MSFLMCWASILMAPPDPPGDWTFVDEAARDGRSVLTYRTVELAESPPWPLHPDDKPAAGSTYGTVGLGPGGRYRLAVVWHAPSNSLWFDADGDGRFAAAERHAPGD